MKCPCCESESFHEVISRRTIAWETELRSHFINHPVWGISVGFDEKDRTDFAHDRIVGLSECATCGLLVRNDWSEDFISVYEQDTYEPAVLEHFLDRDARFFKSCRNSYVSLLSPGAEILEVGSYAGGFLQAAGEWGWNVKGIDVGVDVVQFLKNRGFNVSRTTLEEADIGDDHLDGVFIWNCFDQLPDPKSTLKAALRVLKPGGILVIRVPNALFYRICQPVLAYIHQNEPGALLDKTITRILGYNNLLGFPYQFGYSPSNLRLLTGRFGFEHVRIAASNLILLPAEEAAPGAMAEQQSIRRLLDELAAIASSTQGNAPVSPWMELILKKADSAPGI